MSPENTLGLPTNTQNSERRRRIVVEIGMGDSPFLVNGRKSGRGIRYIGIDNKSSGLSRKYDPFPEISEKLGKIPGLEFELIDGDGASMPLPDHSVDLVHISNIFGDPFILGNKIRFLREVARVLKESGTLRVVETLTPRNYPLGAVRSLAMAVGFAQANRKNEQNFSVLKRYIESFWEEDRMDPDFYIAEFRPVTYFTRVQASL